MSSQHLRPFAAFVLISMMCALVMIRSINAADVNPMRPGGFAVVDGPRQTLASGASDLDRSEGPAITGVAAGSAARPSALTATSSSPSHASTTTRTTRTGRPAAGSGDSEPSPRPTGQPTGQPSDPSSQPGGKPTTGPTPPPSPTPTRTIERLKNQVANLMDRSSRASGAERERLLHRLLVLRLRLKVAELEAGITPEPSPAPSAADPSATDPGETDPGGSDPSAVEPSTADAGVSDPSNRAAVADEDRTVAGDQPQQ